MTTMVAERPQHEVALERANETRLARAAKGREIKALGSPRGMLAVAEFLEGELPVWAEGWPLGDLLGRIDRMGGKRSLKVMQRAGIAPGAYRRRLDRMTARQRLAVATQLRVSAGRSR